MKKTSETVYRCDFCGKRYYKKNFAQYHEELCFHNPENKRPCFDCHSLVKKKATYYRDNPTGGDIETKVLLFYCTKHKLFLWTPQNTIKANMIDTGESEAMPINCDDYEGRDFETYSPEI